MDRACRSYNTNDVQGGVSVHTDTYAAPFTSYSHGWRLEPVTPCPGTCPLVYGGARAGKLSPAGHVTRLPQGATVSSQSPCGGDLSRWQRAGLAGMTSSCSLDLTAPSIYVARPGTQMLNPSYLEPAQLVELRAKWAKPPGDWSAAKLARCGCTKHLSSRCWWQGSCGDLLKRLDAWDEMEARTSTLCLTAIRKGLTGQPKGVQFRD